MLPWNCGRLRLNVVSSALSLRVFGEDITTAAREAAQKRRDERAKAEVATGTPTLSEADAAHEAGGGQEDAPMRTGE